MRLLKQQLEAKIIKKGRKWQYTLVYTKNSRQQLNYQIFREMVLQFFIIIIMQTETKNTLRSMKMNNSQWKMDAQGILPPLIERVDFQLPRI